MLVAGPQARQGALGGYPANMDIAPSEFLIYALAHQAFEEADALAEHLLGMKPPPAHTLFTACVTGIVTSYCRPFMAAKGLRRLPSDMEEFHSKELEAIHADVFEIRHKFLAHFDRKHGEKVTGSATHSLPLSEICLTIREDDFEVLVNAATLSRESVQTIRKLCAFQKQRVSERLEAFAVEIRKKEKRTGKFVYSVE